SPPPGSLQVLQHHDQPSTAVELHGVAGHHARIGDGLHHAGLDMTPQLDWLFEPEEPDPFRPHHQPAPVSFDDIRDPDEAGHEFIRRPIVEVDWASQLLAPAT